MGAQNVHGLQHIKMAVKDFVLGEIIFITWQ